MNRIDELYAQSMPFNAMELWRELNETLWWGTESGSQEEEKQTRRRLQALGWALQELEAWTPESPHALYRLQIVLTTLLTSSPSDREAMEVVPQEAARLPLLDGLVRLLNCVRLSEHQWSEETQAAGRSGDYGKLGNLIRHLQTEFPPDFHLAVMLLTKFAPDRLARHIEERQDVFFSVAVRRALDDEAAEFALLVNDVTFKFICASPLSDKRAADAPEGLVDVICALLLQVARTDLWRSWLLDFARYPHADTVAEKALSEALAQLTAPHWSAFVDAVELWTHAGTAGPVANILVPFLHALGTEKSADMWRLAFERWNKWDYGRDEKDKHLFAPSACSFDFPVAMHYALLSLDEAQVEEARLLEGIATVEQKWFTDLSELVAYRNRLSSRLRLVQHGFAIRNPPPEGASPLPPRIEPDSEFAEVRYRFFDVSAPRRRGK
ncbi:hypothetical protein [Cupriavidus basilensis]|uniref:hypothetical protein n=1 Tax=Cupriavidus basilensis TaxID=68895 RepID=UPI0020A651AD|nr:hypothetical protein [Cupriavidus basilensis]MCP3024296.1 hypothetical protein [Cupriavidus basilensis]